MCTSFVVVKLNMYSFITINVEKKRQRMLEYETLLIICAL
jgi:hypothetical protein